MNKQIKMYVYLTLILSLSLSPLPLLLRETVMPNYMDLFGYSFAGGSALPSYAGQTIHFLSHSSYITFQMPVQ